LSPFRDVDRSTPHLFLAQATRRALPDAYIDMVFFPSQHDRERLLEAGVPLLTGIQSYRSVEDFDLVLLSNAYTLELINLPYLLLHSGVPLRASQRDDSCGLAQSAPIFILGGSNALAAQAVIAADRDSLVDAVFFGEGEGEVEALLACLLAHAQDSKAQQLECAAEAVDGLWLSQRGRVQTVAKAILTAPGAEHLLVDYPILNSAEAGTARLQISYGCPAFCAFCFEGYDRKPYREVPLEAILMAARQLKTRGVDTLELYSFNFNTHTDIFAMLLALNRLFERVSFKSQRVDVLYETPGLLQAEVMADKRSFTLGVEGISPHMRAWLHKDLSESAIMGVLSALLRQKIRTIKLFYILTGHEDARDLAVFHDFLDNLKALRQRANRGIRIIFSFGLLVRMPFTPLQYDRLFLDQEAFRELMGQLKSACETHGFEFRMATPWEETFTSQVLALGGTWLLEAVVALARQGHYYDLNLSLGYWDALCAWMETRGYWDVAFLGEKGPDYPFPLDFVRTGIAPAFLYRQYRQSVEEAFGAPPPLPPPGGRETSRRIEGGALTSPPLVGTEAGKLPSASGGISSSPPSGGIEGGSTGCLGSQGSVGRCLSCGACTTPEQRWAITHHAIRLPSDARYLADLQTTMRTKWRLVPCYARLWVPEWVGGVEPAWLNAWVMRALLAGYPELVENLLAAQEALFTSPAYRDRYAGRPVRLYGEMVFALKAWDPDALVDVLARAGGQSLLGDVRFLALEQDFTPEVFNKLRIRMTLPSAHFPNAGRRLRLFLREGYVPTNLRRVGEGYRFDIPAKALKKKVLFEGAFHQDTEAFVAQLVVGPKFDLLGFLCSFEGPPRYLDARIEVQALI